ncbi:MAG TPA: tetratricopeptide repeat-containing sensor histidine kinase [Bacteroidales bacterium]|nr:tetratricopeptide repeat-containing sensor histidine kinase [Bacteroidales bacterium]
MKKFILSNFFIFLFLSCFGNITTGVDSLYKLLATAHDSLKAKILTDLSWELRNSYPEKSIEYGLKAIELAQKNNDHENYIKAHSFVGVAYRILGKYSEALDYYFKGLELSKQYNDKEQEGYSYINIGNLYIYQEYYNIAIENLLKAREIAEAINHKRMLAYTYLNLGRTKLLKKEYYESLDYLGKSLDLRIELNNIPAQAVCYKYIGDVYFELNQYEKAQDNYDKTIETVDKDSDIDLLANAYVKKSFLYCHHENYQQSKHFAEKSLDLATKVGARLLIRDAYKVLSRINYNLNNYKKAADFNDQIIALNDTLFNQQLNEKIFDLEYRLEKQKKQTEIDLLNKDKKIKELELHRTRLFSIALLIILGILLGTFLYVLHSLRYRRKQNQLLEKQKEELARINTTKDKMFLIIGHDLRGPIGNLRSLIEMLLDDEEIVNNDNLKDIFNVFFKSIQSVSDLLENLLLWAKSQRGELNYQPEVARLNSIIHKNLQLFKTIADHKNILLKAELESDYDVYVDVNMIMTVLRNIISNALKFTSSRGSILVRVYNEKKYCKVSVTDTGIGFDKNTGKQIFNTKNFYTTYGTNNETGSGLGFILCKEFVEINGGKIWAESVPNKGTVFYFTLPVASENKK